MSRTDHFNLPQRVFYKLIRPFITNISYSNWELKRWFGRGTVLQPITFNEKLMWLKCFHHDSRYTTLADKLAVREYVIQKIGSNYLNTLYGVYNNSTEIDFDSLPDQFALKATHGSGMNFIVWDKKSIDKTAIVSQINKWLKIDYSDFGREWVYKQIPHRVIVEKLLHKNNVLPRDFKVFVFHGEPKIIQVDVDRFHNHTRAYYDTEWNRLPFSMLYPAYTGNIELPALALKELLDVSRELAGDIPFVRVDFYVTPKLIFGEMTFIPENCTGTFDPEIWDESLGMYLQIPEMNQHEYKTSSPTL